MKAKNYCLAALLICLLTSLTTACGCAKKQRDGNSPAYPPFVAPMNVSSWKSFIQIRKSPAWPQPHRQYPENWREESG